MAQKNLHTAKQQKNDEFYTQLNDIANELRHYRDQLQGKVILCNCDDPFESNFFKYFAANFKALGIKKLITTGYTKSPITGSQLNLIDIEGLKPEAQEPYVVEINEVPDLNDDGAVSLDDVEYLLKHDKNVVTKLLGDDTYPAGDFRSAQCVELLDRADIVITNPPFSLFREFIALLVEHKKQFLVLGNQNAITYKETFKLIRDNKLWLGYDNGGTKWFQVPDDYDIATESRKKIENGIKYFSMGSILWYTNLYVDRSTDPLTPYLTYEQGLARGLYPKYDNYDAIEVSKVADIPSDYMGVMGVPITFLYKWTPDMEDMRERERERERDGKSSEIWVHTHQTDTRWRQQSSSTARRSSSEYSSGEFRIIGLDRYAEGNTMPNRRMHINGKEIYARILVQRV